MRITVINTNLDIVFFPDTKIRIKENNPIFSEEGTYSFPFDAPLEENMRALDYIHKINNSAAKTFDYDVRVESQLIPDKYGILTVTPYTTTLGMNLVLGDGRFNNLLKSTDLRDIMDEEISLGDDTDDVIDHAETAITQTWPTTPYNFPVIHSDDFYGDANADFVIGKKINYYEPDKPGFRKNYIDEEADPKTVFNFTCLIPFLYISEILTRVIDYLGFQLIGNVLTHAAISKLLLWNNYTLDNFHWPVCNAEFDTTITLNSQSGFLEVHQLDFSDVFLDEDNLLDTTYWTPQVPGWYKFITSFTTSSVNNPHYLAVQIKNFLTSDTTNIADGFEADGEYHETEVDGNVDIFISQSDIDSGIKYSFQCVITYLNIPEESPCEIYLNCNFRVFPIEILNTFATSLNLANHVPDITAAELFSEIEKAFCFKAFQDGDDIQLHFIKDILNEKPTLDLSAYILSSYLIGTTDRIKSLVFSNASTKPIDEYTLIDSCLTKPGLSTTTYQNNILQLVQNLMAYWITTYSDTYEIVWEKHSDNLHGLEIRETGSEISIAITPASMQTDWVNPLADTEDDYDTWHGFTPVAPDQAYSTLFRCYNDMNLFMFYFLGLIPVQWADDSQTYPAASTGIISNSGSQISNLIELTFDGDDGLYENFHKEYIEFRNNADFLTFNFNLPQAILQQLKFFKMHQAKGIEFIIASKDYEFDIATDEIIQPVTLEVYKKNV